MILLAHQQHDAGILEVVCYLPHKYNINYSLRLTIFGLTVGASVGASVGARVGLSVGPYFVGLEDTVGNALNVGS